MDWKTTGSPHHIKSNGEMKTKAYDVAETMNSWFLSKLISKKSSLNSIIWTPNICNDIMKNKKCKLSLKFPTKSQVLKYLKNLSSSKCSAIDGLDNFILKVSSEIIVDHIHHIICLSLMQEKFQVNGRCQRDYPCTKRVISLNHATIDLF